MIDYIQIRITPGRFSADRTLREIEIITKTWNQEYMIREIYPEDYMESHFDILMNRMREQLRQHIKDDQLKSAGKP